MLEKLRNQSNSWFFKLLLIIIAASFFIFGIGDMIRGIVSHRPIASVGNAEITMPELDAHMRREMRRIQSQSQQPISLKDLMQMGFVNKILDTMITRLVIDQEMQRLGLVVSENIIRDSIYSMEPFQQNGQFDSTKFNTILKNAGLNQKVLIDDIRNQTIDRQYFQSFNNAAMLPKFYRDLLHSAILSKRSFSVLKIDSQKMTLPQNPTREEMNTYFEENKANYVLPEKRNIQLMVIDVKKLSATITLSESDLKAAFEDKKHLYFTPETRDLKKIIFATKENAEMAKEQLKNGIDIDQIKNIEKPSIQIIKAHTKNLLPLEHQESVFSLKQNGYTDILSAGESYIIYHVQSISKEKQLTFDDVKNKLLHDERLERYQNEFKALRDKIEDELAGGNNLSKVSKDLGLTFIEVNNIEAAPDSVDLFPKQISPTQAQKIIEQTFGMEEGAISTIIDFSPELSCVIGVAKIMPAHQSNIDAVKEKVTNDMISYLKDQKAMTLVNQLMKEAKNVQDFALLSKKHGLALETGKVYLRMEIYDNDILRKNAMVETFERTFSAPLGQPVVGRYKNGFIIVAAEKDLPATAEDSKKSRTIIERIEHIMSESLLQLLISGMKINHKVTIKTDNLNTFIGMMTKTDE